MATERSEQNLAAVDPWTLVHFSSGLAAGLMRLSFGKAAAVAVAYEVVEQIAERNRLGQELFHTTRPESLPNALADLLAFGAGYGLGRLWHRTGE